MELKNINGVIIHSGDFESIKDLVINAIKNHISLQGAYLRGADLRRADLRRADLQGAYLRRADLRRADLREANLREADLEGADLQGADLREANLREADLEGADLLKYQIIPETGSFEAFKKTTKGVIKILIPKDAKRTSNLIGRKCRASHVKVLQGSGFSPTHDNKIEYKEGETVHADSYNDDIRIDCTNGIHFFLTKKEAEEW